MAVENEILNYISPSFRPYVQSLNQDFKLGLCQSKIDIEVVSNSINKSNTQFVLVIPYCSKKIKWEVLFDGSIPWFAPDFRFDDDHFLSNVEEEYMEKYIPSLAQWNEKDPQSLCKVVAELLKLYKKYQVNKINEDSRESFEYSSLLGETRTDENDVEVWVGAHSVEFLIKLNVDISRLPEIYSDGYDENPGADSALLLVRYPYSTNAELILSPLLTKAIGNISLPPMHEGGVLIDYVPLVTQILNKRIQTVLNNEKTKREILSQMIVKYEGAILEHDANSASFLFETNDFQWVLQINLDVNFPDRPPILTIRSVYHSAKGKPKFKVLPMCPYSNFENYIEEQVEIFKKECVGANQSNQES